MLFFTSIFKGENNTSLYFIHWRESIFIIVISILEENIKTYIRDALSRAV